MATKWCSHLIVDVGIGEANPEPGAVHKIAAVPCKPVLARVTGGDMKDVVVPQGAPRSG